MKKYRPLIASAIILSLLVCVPLLSPNKSVAIAGNGSNDSLFAESPNITVVDQFGLPVANVKLNVLFEADGVSNKIEVNTPQNGFVPISGKSGTYTFTVSSVPDGYTSTDQKVIQTYQNGASYSGKQITIHRNDDNNPFSTNTTVNASGGNFTYNPTVNFTANIAFEFKMYLKDIVKEVIQELDAEEQKAVPAPSPTPTPTVMPSPEPIPTPTPIPTPEPTTDENTDLDLDLVCAIVAHEGGQSYEGAMAVISAVMNRVDSGYRPDAVSVLTAPGQFTSYLDGTYTQFLGGKYPNSVKQAVKDCILGGIRTHNFLSYRSYETSGSVNIAGNWYF